MKELEEQNAEMKDVAQTQLFDTSARKAYRTPELREIGSMATKTKGPNQLLGSDVLVLGGS
ncbi:hypothetical protein ACXWTF_08785 [Thiomicrolovo sp. ZZH C-3]